MDNIQIRKAVEQDREDIAFVYAEAFANDWEQLSSDTQKVARALSNGLVIDKYIVVECNHSIIAFLALVDDEQRAFQVPVKDFQKEFGFLKGYMVGMALKSDMERSIPLKENTAYLDIIGVRKSFQHQGIASCLIQYVFDTYTYASYIISVTDINEHALACYKKNGFQEVYREQIKYAKQRGFQAYIYLKYEK